MPAPTIFDAQGALEEAVVEAIRVSPPPRGIKGGYDDDNLCRAMFDGRPPPLCGEYFASVWSDNGRKAFNTEVPTYLGDELSVFVTITIRTPALPWDRLLTWRRELSARANDIRALIAKDCYDNRILRRANTLANFDDFTGASSTKHVGFRQFVTYLGIDPLQKVGPDHFHGAPDKGKVEVGVAQTVRFGRVKWYQGLLTSG